MVSFHGRRGGDNKGQHQNLAACIAPSSPLSIWPWTLRSNPQTHSLTPHIFFPVQSPHGQSPGFGGPGNSRFSADCSLLLPVSRRYSSIPARTTSLSVARSALLWPRLHGSIVKRRKRYVLLARRQVEPHRVAGIVGVGAGSFRKTACCGGSRRCRPRTVSPCVCSRCSAPQKTAPYVGRQRTRRSKPGRSRVFGRVNPGGLRDTPKVS